MNTKLLDTTTLREVQIEAQRDTTMYLLERLLQKVIVSYWWKCTHALLVGMQNGTVSLEKSLVVSLTYTDYVTQRHHS